MPPFGRSWMRAKSLQGLGAEHRLEVPGDCPLRRPMLSDFMTDFGPPRQELFGATRPAAVRPHIACTLRDVGCGGQGSQSIAQPIRRESWDSSNRWARSFFQRVPGPGIRPYGASVRSPHYARVDAPLVQGSLVSAGVNPPCRCWSSVHPSPRFRSRHDHLRRDYCKLSPAPSTAR